MYVVKFSASNACMHVYVFGSLSKQSEEVWWYFNDKLEHRRAGNATVLYSSYSDSPVAYL